MKKNLLSAISIIGIYRFPVNLFYRSYPDRKEEDQKNKSFDDQIMSNAKQLFTQGRNIFRFETFGDEIFWSNNA